MEPLAVGFHAVERGRVNANDTVCVIGCGMIGLGAIAGAALKQNALLKELDILGSRNATRSNFQAVIKVLRSGSYPVQDTITLTTPFAEAANAMREWDEDPGSITKIHIEVG